MCKWTEETLQFLDICKSSFQQKKLSDDKMCDRVEEGCNIAFILPQSGKPNYAVNTIYLLQSE